MRHLAPYLTGDNENAYVVGAYALGAEADTNAAAVALWQAQQQQKKSTPASVGPQVRESGISIGGVALLVGAILVGLATWPRVSRWLG